MSKLHQHDKLLFVALLILNIGSGITTIQGATQIFPLGVGVFSGFAIQAMLFLLLSRLAARHTPVRKWVAVFVFASLSVYTSFFAYYGTLTTNVRSESLRDPAVVAHQKLVAEVYTPLENQLGELQNQIKSYEAQKRKEIEGNGIPGTEGDGEIATRLQNKIRAAEDKVATLEPLVERLEPLFKYETDKMPPEKILDLDRKALSTVPRERLIGDFKANPILQESTYIDKVSSIRILEPFHKISQKDPVAVFALTIAIMIDGMIILLGTAIEPRQRKDPFETHSHLIATIIIGVKSSWATIEKAIRQPRLPFDTPREDETLGLRDGVNLVTLRLKGRGSAFLEEFYNAISPETGLIDYERLRGNANTTFATSYRILLDALSNPRLQWIGINSNQCYVANKCYAPLMRWLSQEMVHQCEQEEVHKASEEFYASPRNVPIRIPSGI